jgi:hypothetical protein
MPDVFDFLASFPLGMNSGDDPLLLPKTQLAFAGNGTMRGNFFKPRPAYNNLNLVFTDQLTESNFQTGFYQGAGFYQPDTGPESLAIQIGGHQFLVTPDSSGNAAISEITIPGDPDSSTQAQAWPVQAENFLIFNNGLDLPFFYDGSASRRSYGSDTEVLGTVNTNAAIPVPAIGSSANLPLSSPYTGPTNQSVMINGAVYVVTAINQNVPSYQVVLKNLYDTESNEPGGTSVVSNPSQLGVGTWGGTDNDIISFTCGVLPSFVQVGGQVSLSFANVASPTTVTITQLIIENGSPVGIRFNPGIPKLTQKNVTTATYLGYSGPTPSVGTMFSGFEVPATNSNVTTLVSTGFSGVPGQIYWIGGGQYLLVSLASIPPSQGSTITVENITDGSQDINNLATITTLPELPAGRTLAYGMGRIWESLTDGVSFIAGDIVRGNSGSPQYNFRDAVLKTVENTFLYEGGTFSVPGNPGDIRAMQFVALLDVSLGQGPLQVFTPQSIFGCQAPADRSTWQSLTYPILTQSLVGAGAASQAAVCQANGDILFRAADGTIRSLLMARLDFNRWANTPISFEMSRVLNVENNSLLAYSVATPTPFDNRALFGAGLNQCARGVYSTSLIALNFDPISSLKGEGDTIYDGQWTGLNVLGVVNGSFSGVQRCFAVCLSQDLTQIEIHEILPSEGPLASAYDDGEVAITSYLESPAMDFGDRKTGQRNYHRLSYGEIYVDQISGPVQFQAFYKPDQWPEWVPWYSWTQDVTPNTDPGFRPRVGLPMPDAKVYDTVNNRPLRECYSFQFKLVITGPARFLGARFSADVIPQPKFAAPVSSA